MNRQIMQFPSLNIKYLSFSSWSLIHRISCYRLHWIIDYTNVIYTSTSNYLKNLADSCVGNPTRLSPSLSLSLSLSWFVSHLILHDARVIKSKWIVHCEWFLFDMGITCKSVDMYVRGRVSRVFFSYRWIFTKPSLSSYHHSISFLGA